MAYVWPTVRDHLTQCGLLSGPSAIEIRPHHPPTALNSQYSRAKQRIYLSATLCSMDDLQRRVGGGPATPLTTAEPLPPGATGERLLVLNPGGEHPFDQNVLGWALAQAQAAGGRAAWLCASHAEADPLQEALTANRQQVYRLRPGDDSMVDTWRRVAKVASRSRCK